MVPSLLKSQPNNSDKSDTKAPPLESSTRSAKEDLGPVNAFVTNFPKDNQHHVEDLQNTPTNKAQILVLNPSLTYIVYMHRALKNIIVTLMFEWTMPLFNPLNFLLLVTVFPTCIITIILLEIALQIGFKLGFGSVIRNVADKWGGGLSLVNWWDPRIFTSDVDEIVEDGIKELDAPLPPPLPEEELDDLMFGGAIQHRGFNLDIAEMLLFMSCIIYERNGSAVREAHKILNKLSKKHGKNKGLMMEQVNSVTNLLRESESRIHKQAEAWGLEFTSLSELNSLGGPFSGMFWSNEHNFIVVAFKGTSPSNFEDFVIDLMFQRIDARSFVFGEVHEGFYTSLFPKEGSSAARASHSSPYITMIRAIRAKAADIRAHRKDDQLKINVWITGHSLGAALASLFYARLLKSTRDLGPHCILRDGYMFGSPSVGDADFAAEFSSYSNTPYDRQSTLWRIIDDSDIITKIPPGWSDPSIRRLVNKSSIMNYVHIGEGIRFFQNGARPTITNNIFSSGKEPVIIQRGPENVSILGQDDQDDDERRWRPKKDVFHGREEFKHMTGSPLIFIEKILPTCFRNHLPARYFSVMQKARIYFDDNMIIVDGGSENVPKPTSVGRD